MLGAAVAEVIRTLGHQAVAIAHRRPVPSSCTQVDIAISDVEALTRAWDGVDAIVHLAAIFTGSAEEMREVNIDATRAVADAAERLGARLVFAGSASIYAPGEMIDADESFPKAPVDAYGWSKLQAEDELPPSACILRLPSLISTAPCPIHSMLSGLVQSTGVPYPEDRGAPIELAPVNDVARAVLLAVEDDKAHGPYNVSGADRPRFVDIVECAAAAMDVAPKWVSEDQANPVLWRQATETRTLSLHRVKTELGYRPVEDWRTVLFGAR